MTLILAALAFATGVVLCWSAVSFSEDAETAIGVPEILRLHRRATWHGSAAAGCLTVAFVLAVIGTS